MRIDILQNKSVAIIGTLVSEAATVAEYRQFAIGDKVEYDGKVYTLLTVDTLVRSDKCLHNVYVVFDRALDIPLELSECLLLEQNPQPCPKTIFDVFHDVLYTPPFVLSDNVFVTGHKA